MKNQTVYSESSYEFYKKVKSKKTKKDLKLRLGLIDHIIEQLFEDYDNHYDDNNLQSLEPHGFVGQPKLDLEELYKYSSKTLTDLQIALTTTPTGRNVKCQYCTINAVNTFDHLVPQGFYSEFVVHPKNLFCSCSDCNSRKGAIWRNAGQRTSLNLYLDQLPNLQYLFVEIDVQNTSIGTRFFLNNTGNIDVNLFQILNDHYTKLGLFKRFSENANDVITSFLLSAEPAFSMGTPEAAKAFILSSLEKEKVAFGFNYWETLLKIELLRHPEFLRLLQELV
ncbi:conserved hypothetical protein [Sphingobacterium sp. PM2-P1-29]|nr:conserved hypothetical protein [Sphingobacterium sp. PM2-P1-29]